jgi:hypothetical protein
MLHCYRCNKAGIPIKDALCGECRATIKKWSFNSWATKLRCQELTPMLTLLYAFSVRLFKFHQVSLSP